MLDSKLPKLASRKCQWVGWEVEGYETSAPGLTLGCRERLFLTRTYNPELSPGVKYPTLSHKNKGGGGSAAPFSSQCFSG